MEMLKLTRFHAEAQLIMWILFMIFEMTLISIVFAPGILLNIPGHHESKPHAM